MTNQGVGVFGRGGHGIGRIGQYVRGGSRVVREVVVCPGVQERREETSGDSGKVTMKV